MKRRTFLAAGTLSVTGLAGCLGDTEYRITEATVDDSLEPLSVSAHLSVANATIEHPAEIVLTLENIGDEPVRIRSYGVWPFGVIALAPSPTPGEDTWEVTLFSPSYDSSNRVEVRRGGSSMSIDGTPVTQTLEPGESVSSQYELRGDDLSRAGTYYIVTQFERRSSEYTIGDEWTTLDYPVRVTIEEKERLSL